LSPKLKKVEKHWLRTLSADDVVERCQN